MTTTTTFPATATADSWVMERLRAETRADHDATEAIPFSRAMVEQVLPRDRYIAKLQAYAIVHRVLDEALAASDHPAVEKVWRDDLRKTPLLEKDLDFFDQQVNDDAHTDALEAAERFAEAIHETTSDDPVSLLGYLYVLEGSTLGGTILRKHIAAAYGLERDGLAYYSPYGNAVMPHWKQFKQRMNDSVTDRADQDRMIAAANAAFGYIGDILRALSHDLPVGKQKSETENAEKRTVEN